MCLRNTEKQVFFVFYSTFTTFVTVNIKKTDMTTLVVDIDDKSNIDKIIEALRLFKGVKRVSLEENLMYPELNKSIEELNDGKTVRCKTMADLIENLNS